MTTLNVNLPIVEPGYRVLDPLDKTYRTVTKVVNKSVYMKDGGVMELKECNNILLPSEKIPNNS